jgi:pimeloyl-ACP methyl ester carboxylesterase
LPSAAPPIPSAPPSSQLEPLEGPWIRELPLFDGRKTYVAVPAGARAPLPVLVAVHGAGDRADWACSEWTAILAGTAIVVCPEGRPSQWKGTFAWGSAQHIAENADAALEAVRAKFGAHVGPWPPIYAAWSQGGTLAGQVMALRPQKYRRVVMSEVGHTPLDPKATATAMAGAGVERVIVSCTTAPCRTWARSFEREATAKNVGVKINDAGDRGHVFDEPVFKLLAPKVLWLIDKDEGWSGVSAGIEGKWGKP